MPIIKLPSWMNAPLGPPTRTLASEFWRWFREGIIVFAPASVRNLGLRARARFIQMSDKQDDTECTLSRSWLGEITLDKVSHPQADLPVQLSLAPGQYFTTSLRLPPQAISRIKKTISLRLGDISPIPPEEAAFAVARPRRTANDRLDVDIAITRKTTLAEVRNKYAERKISALGAAPTDKGEFRFEFETHPTALNWGKIGFGVAMTIAAALFLAVAVNAHLSRRLENLTLHEEALRVELRNLRPAVTLFEDADPEVLKEHRGKPIFTALNEIGTHVDILPEKIRVQSLSLAQDRVQISGYIPADVDMRDAECPAMTQSPSERPGFDFFNCEMDVGLNHD